MHDQKAGRGGMLSIYEQLRTIFQNIMKRKGKKDEYWISHRGGPDILK